MNQIWNKVGHIADADFNVTGVPAILKNYTMYSEKDLVCRYSKDFLHSFVHYRYDPIEEHVYYDIKKLCDENINGIYTNYVCLYSFTLNSKFLELQKEYDNFTFYHLPLITFEDVTRYLDLDLLPPIEHTYTRKYCCLMNRSFRIRRLVFEHLRKNNLLDKGFVSYRNTIRLHYEGESPQNLIEKPFINFIDKKYPLENGGVICTGIWLYPQQDFLFDFGIETHAIEYVCLTEKSTKSFLWGKIPIILGCRNSMHYLEELGFDIFRDIINFSYDMQKDIDMRLEMFLEQLDSIINIDIDKIYNLKQRLQSNRNLMCKLAKRSLQSLEDINLNTEYILQNKVKFLGY